MKRLSTQPLHGNFKAIVNGYEIVWYGGALYGSDSVFYMFSSQSDD